MNTLSMYTVHSYTITSVDQLLYTPILVPSVSVVPSRIEATFGEDVSFDCVATGMHIKKILWERDGKIELGANSVSTV